MASSPESLIFRKFKPVGYFRKNKNWNKRITNEIKSYSSITNSYFEKMLSNLLSKFTDYLTHISSEVIGSIVSQIIVEWEACGEKEKLSGLLGNNRS